MAELAINGHVTRGKEVIEILEMLGGINKYNLRGDTDEWFVLNGTQIQRTEYLFDEKGFTLEEFLEKYPYKVGDKVKAWVNGYCGVFNIQDITWDSIAKEVKYRIHDYWHSVENLQPYKEETMERGTNKAIFEGNAQSCDIMNGIIKEETMEDKGTLEQIDLTKELRKANNIEVILGDYEFVLKNGKTYFVKKKPQYPKTYKECCDVLGLNTMDNDAQGYKEDLIIRFQELIIARDGYWKIAGEQMGLDKPWKPDWDNENEFKYSLYYFRNRIVYDYSLFSPTILAFPTEEMRDAFYENFKDLIESCKELL